MLFYSHTSYGYRMRPNQETWRFNGAHFKINNLGLRAKGDWGSGIANKDPVPRRAAALDERRSWYQDNEHLKAHAVWGELIREELIEKLPARAMRVGR